MMYGYNENVIALWAMTCNYFVIIPKPRQTVN
jgi:hypothetical protein